jgi:hypothetical protein
MPIAAGLQILEFFQIKNQNSDNFNLYIGHPLKPIILSNLK